MRGGSYFNNAQQCRSAYRNNNWPDNRNNNIGFRLVLCLQLKGACQWVRAATEQLFGLLPVDKRNRGEY